MRATGLQRSVQHLFLHRLLQCAGWPWLRRSPGESGSGDPLALGPLPCSSKLHGLKQPSRRSDSDNGLGEADTDFCVAQQTKLLRREQGLPRAPASTALPAQSRGAAAPHA